MPSTTPLPGFLSLQCVLLPPSIAASELIVRRLQTYVTGPSRGFSDSHLDAVGLGASTLPRTDTLFSSSSYRSDISGVYPLPAASTETDYDEKEGERAAHSSSSTSFLGEDRDRHPTEVPLPSSSSFATSTSTHSNLHSSRAPSTSAATTSAEHGHPPSLLAGHPSAAPPTRPFTPPFPYTPPSTRNSTRTGTNPPSSSVPIPLIHSRARIRDILAAVVSATTYSGSVFCGTCGPSALTDEVGNACADAIRPRKVWEGEHRVTAVSSRELLRWVTNRC